MRKILALMLILMCLSFPLIAFAGCYVEDGTFYANSKSSMTAFVLYMDKNSEYADLKKALQMVDDGRIMSCTRASCFVLKRTKEGLVHVNIMGIGNVWIYKNFLHCK